MKTLSHELKALFMEAAVAAFPELSEGELLEVISLEEPRDASHGDFACSAPFKLTKRLGKSPQDIGQALVDHFPKDHRVGSVEFVPPGFVNLRLKVSFLEELLKQLESGFSVEGHESTSIKDRKAPVIVEYPSTNAAKHLGVHHIITTILGDAVANLFEFMGYEVLRINHLGDWGTHFGKLIYAVETWGDQAVIHSNPIDELTKLYVRFNEAAEKDPALDDEARAIFKSLEAGDELRMAVWKWIVNESNRELDTLLDRMGIHIQHHMGESFYLKMADEVLEEGIKKGVFKEGEKGALIFDMGEDQVPALVRKGDGTTLYLTRDIATVKYRVETWHPEHIFYIVDHAQSLHFQQNFAICKAMGYEGDTHLEHVSFGRMRFQDASMSTRKGNVIRLTELLDEAVKRAGDLAAERGSELPRAELATLMEVMGISAVKYGVLSQDRNKDIIFEWDKIITLEGNSAPYLLYSYARGMSIVGKLAEEVPLSGLPTLSEEAELELMRLMVKTPEALERALAERKPHIVATQLYEMAQSFNRFYAKLSVAGAETEAAKRSRLGLVNAFLHQLKAGLGILGIPVVERV